MSSHLNRVVEQHPVLGYIGSFFALLMSWLTWFIEHAGDFAQFFGLGAALFGFIAGYYTFRIQRRTWKRGETRPPYRSR